MHSIPVLYTRGTHYEVGFNIGKSFGHLILDFINNLSFYNKISLPYYALPEGKEAYNRVLAICTERFPQYVEEIRGTADGTGIPFHKLFILHVEDLMTASNVPSSPKNDFGCTDIMVNNDTGVVMGHTEDAYPECQGRTYIVHAEIVDEVGTVIEQFASIAYPGFLPGYTQGFNNHGMIHSMNTLNPTQRNPNGTPREFLARALLSVKTLDEAVTVLKNPGYGIADGFNVNIHFSKDPEANKKIYSIEVGPAREGQSESELDILEVPIGDSYYHCNRYWRLPLENVPNFIDTSTDFRQATLSGLPKARCVSDVRKQLSDRSNSEWPIYRSGRGKDKGKTVMTGIFDTSQKTWSLYTGPSVSSPPCAVLSLNF